MRLASLDVRRVSVGLLLDNIKSLLLLLLLAVRTFVIRLLNFTSRIGVLLL